VKIIADSGVGLYPKNSQRYFDSGVKVLAAGGAAYVGTPERTWRVEEDQVLLEIGLFIGVSTDDDAGAVMEGSVNIADLAQVGVAQLAAAVNPIVLAHFDYHAHQWIAGAAGGFSFLWNAWKVFQYPGYKWVLEEDDLIYMNCNMGGTYTAARSAQFAAYLLTARKK